MNESDDNYIEGYIRGTLLPDYDDYCPLLGVSAVRQSNGKYRVDDSGVEIDRSEIKNSAGFLIVQLGGIRPDHTLESAARAIYEGMFSLFAACNAEVRLETFRTTVELSEYMKIYRCNYSHIILIGHGDSNGIPFLDKQNPVTGTELSGYFGADAHNNEIQIISLCCHSGCEKLSSSLSSSPGVSEVIAPNEIFDLRWSVHFITGMYLAMYVTGLSVDDAVTECSRNISGLKMCVWRKGRLTTSCE